MFTGIIQNWGIVKSIRSDGRSARLRFAFKHKEKKVAAWESIAVNGACLTATQINGSGFSADLLPETLAVTNLGFLSAGDIVNMERSLKAGDAVGGHFVTGHVDALGEVLKIEKRGGNWSLLVRAPKTIISKLTVKGSVACDGVSLTVQALSSASLRVAIIPHTLAVTTLHLLQVGSRVNLEADHSLEWMRGTKKVRGTGRLEIRKLIRQGF